MAKTYDEKCGDLARHFLEDEGTHNTPENVADLASDIQDVIEGWFLMGPAKKDVPVKRSVAVPADFDDEARDGKADEYEARQERET